MQIEYPSDWELYTIDSLGTIVTGTTPSTSHPEYYGGNVPFISPADLGDNRFIKQGESTLTRAGAKKARLIPPNSILVTCIGLLGKIGQAKKELTTNQQINSLVPSSKINDSFAYWVLHTLRSQLEAEAGLQVVPIVNKSTFSKLTVSLPPLPEQRRIAEILDSADEAIRATERVIDKLKQVKKGLLHDLLTRGLDENGQLRDPGAHPEQFKESALGRIPKDWNIYRVDELCYLGRGRVISKNDLNENPGNHPVYSSQSQNGGVFGYLNTYDFDGEYVTWTTDGAYAGTVFYRSGKFNCTNVCGTLEQKASGINMRYLASILSRHTKKYVSYVGNPKLMNKVMAEIPISLPTLQEQYTVAKILDNYDARIQAEEAKLAKLKQVKRGLMDDLLTGKVRVSV